MTNSEYKQIIERWTTLISDVGITLSSGDPVPPVFWKTFLGISRTVHVEIMNDTYRRKEFSPGLAQTIKFAELLDRQVFLNEVMLAIPLYEASKRR